MAEVEAIKEEVLKLKCSFCNHFLTVPPITITSPEGDEFKCGRCKDIANTPNLAKFILLEAIGKCMTWPCTFEECSETLEWSQIEGHEISCRCKKLLCPQENCTSLITLGTLADHIENVHFDHCILQIENEQVLIPININNDESETKIILLIEDNLQFLLFVHAKIVLLTYIGKPDKYKKFSINITDTVESAQDQHFAYENQNIQSFNNNIHCIECFKGDCSIVTHSHITTDDIGTKINWNRISNLFSNSITLKIILIPNIVEGTICAEKAQSINTNHFNELRRNLECIVCTQIMTSPIHNCEVGHSVCFHCKNSVQHCPSCRRLMTESRNYSVQFIIEHIQFPCQFWTNGCDFMDKISNVVEHEENCLRSV